MALRGAHRLCGFLSPAALWAAGCTWTRCCVQVSLLSGTCGLWSPGLRVTSILSLLLNLCLKSLFPREKISFYFKDIFYHYPKCCLGQGICSRKGLERPEKQSWEREDSPKSPATLSLEHMAAPAYGVIATVHQDESIYSTACKLS